MSFGDIRRRIEERRRLLRVKEQVARQLASTPIGRLASEVGSNRSRNQGDSRTPAKAA
jgi:hypothetical protein